MCLGLRVQEIARDIARVDRLDGKLDALLFRLARGEAQIAHEGRAMPRALLAVGLGGQHAGHDVHPRAGERLRVAQGGDHARREFVLAAGKRREAAIALAHIARRRIDQNLHQTVRIEARGNLLRGEVVAEAELDCREAVVSGRGETIEERRLGVEERKIRGEARHAVSGSQS